MMGWKSHFYTELATRNDHQIHSFSSIIDHYQDLLSQYNAVKQQNTTLQKRVKTLSDENSTLRDENTGLKSDGKVPVYSKDHEEKVYQLQEELTSVYRARSEDKQQMLDISSENKRLKGEVETRDEQIAEHERTHDALTQTIQDLNHEIAKKDAAIELLRAEHESAKSALGQCEEELEKCRRDNKELVERVVEMKMEQAEAMNEVHELHQALVEERKALEQQRERYRTQSASAPGAPGGGGGGGGRQQQQRAVEGKEEEEGSVRGQLQELGPGARGSGAFGVGDGLAVTTSMLHRNPSAQQQRERIAVDPPQTVLFKKNVDVQINCVKFSGDGSRLLIGCNDKTLKLWNAKTGHLLQTLHGSTEGVTNVAISSNGHTVLGCSTDSTCRMWDIANGNRLVHTLTGHTKKIYGVDFSRDDTKCVTGSHDRTMKIWDLARGITIRTLITTCRSSVNDLEISHNDMVVSGHFDGNIRIHDLKSQKMIHEIEKAHSQQVTSVHFSHNNRYLLSCGRDNIIKVWDLHTYKQLHAFSHSDFRNNMNSNKVVFSPSTEFIAAGGADGTIYFWNTVDQRMCHQLKKNGHTNSITGTAWSPDGLTLASVSLDRHLILWN